MKEEVAILGPGMSTWKIWLYDDLSLISLVNIQSVWIGLYTDLTLKYLALLNLT